ncbi:hypothetical protein PFISCL1PPCAC_21607, partial [Pristionchus fissidentatus]
MSRLSLLIVFALAAYAAADTDFVEEIKKIEPFKIQSSSFACPVPIVGQTCPEANPLFYFKCCGELAKDCCFRLQGWSGKFSVYLLLSIAIC